MAKTVERIEAREGYDRWSKIYDQRASALVALDRRYTLRHLRPQADEQILDAGCGTGVHLDSIRRAGARAVGLVFSAFHPDMAAAGVEANFEVDGTEYRLGAEQHTVVNYLDSVTTAGFESLRWCEYEADRELVETTPSAAKYLGRPLLLIIEAKRPA